MHNEIIYTNLAAKPMRPAPAPIVRAPSTTPASPSKRIYIGWGAEARKGVAARTEAIAAADDQQQPKQELNKSSSRLARVRQSVRSVSETPPSIEIGRVERYSKLERIRGRRLLSEELDRRSERTALEHLTILHSESTQQYRIGEARTGEAFLTPAFVTLRHCHEAAAELERTFAIAQVLEMRSPETMESVGELVREHWLRERVAVALVG